VSATCTPTPDQLYAIVSGHKDRTFLVLCSPASRSWRALRPETFKTTKLPKTPPGALTARRGRRWHTLLGQKGSVNRPQ
jgi:hypothetical protein